MCFRNTPARKSGRVVTRGPHLVPDAAAVHGVGRQHEAVHPVVVAEPLRRRVVRGRRGRRRVGRQGPLQKLQEKAPRLIRQLCAVLVRELLDMMSTKFSDFLTTSLVGIWI